MSGTIIKNTLMMPDPLILIEKILLQTAHQSPRSRTILLKPQVNHIQSFQVGQEKVRVIFRGSLAAVELSLFIFYIKFCNNWICLRRRQSGNIVPLDEYFSKLEKTAWNSTNPVPLNFETALYSTGHQENWGSIWIRQENGSLSKGTYRCQDALETELVQHFLFECCALQGRRHWFLGNRTFEEIAVV